VQLVAVCDIIPERAQEVADKYGAKKTYTDSSKLAEDPDVEAVTVATQIPDHREPVIAAAEAGKSVFVEKPIAENLKDADAMISATNRAGVPFMVGHILRFENRYAQAKRAIDEGKMGKIASIYARRNLRASLARSHHNWGFPFIFEAIHDTDLMLWYLGQKVHSVYAVVSAVGKATRPDNPDCGWAVYNFEGGAKGVCENVYVLLDNALSFVDGRMEILGTEGAIYIDCFGENGLLVNDKNGTTRPDTIHYPEMHGGITGALRDEVQYWINCVAKDKKPEIITPSDARDALEIVLAAESSARKGVVVSLT
jgi:UDP-N-acetylglucosamine 3-dehydrogenase